jgi:uncharacterized protein
MSVRRRAVAVFMSAMLAVPLLVAAAAVDSTYQTEIEQFRQKRNESLKRNWITLAGLFWLKPGTNTIGSGRDNDVVLPKGPARLGTLELHGKDVTLRLNSGAQATIDDKPARPITRMAVDTTGNPTLLSLGSLRITVIERSDKIGVRVKDTESPALKTFNGTEWFPTDPNLRVEAKWVPETGKKIAISNVLGQTEQTEVPGEAVFTVNGKELHLQPIQEEPDSLFFIFSDATKGETYPGGRFLYTDMPKDGKVVLDFNKAYSPPCAFTAYATCPLAPKENRLPVRIEAGEKYSGHH